MVLIQTRWHEDDLAGRLLAEMERAGNQWDVLALLAEAEENDPLGRKPSEMLWDDEYGYAKFLAHEKATQPARNRSALYQQQPEPESGNYFQEGWLKPFEQGTGARRCECGHRIMAGAIHAHLPARPLAGAGDTGSVDRSRQGRRFHGSHRDRN